MPGLQDFKVTYQISPIVLVGGVATNIPGGLLPIISILQAQDYDLGILAGSTDVNLDQFFGHFRVLPGATLMNNEVATYPFANQSIAANAVVVQPLQVSLLMEAPAQLAGSLTSKLSTFSSLKATLDKHTALGGTYNVATPAYLYQNCLLVGLRDVSTAGVGQPQSSWQFDFFQPLLTLDQAQQAQNALLSKIGAGQQVVGDPPSYSGQSPNVGTTASASGSQVIPAASSTGAAAFGPLVPV